MQLLAVLVFSMYTNDHMRIKVQLQSAGSHQFAILGYGLHSLVARFYAVCSLPKPLVLIVQTITSLML